MAGASFYPIAACSSGFAHRHASVRLPQICNHHLARHCLCAAARTSADDLDPLYGDESTCPVPLAQQPAHQLEQLQQVPVFAWATRPVDQWLWQIGLVWLASTILLGLPISRSSFPHEHQLAQCLFASSIGGLLVVTGVVARLWLVRVCCRAAALKFSMKAGPHLYIPDSVVHAARGSNTFVDACQVQSCPMKSLAGMMGRWGPDVELMACSFPLDLRYTPFLQTGLDQACQRTHQRQTDCTILSQASHSTVATHTTFPWW